MGLFRRRREQPLSYYYVARNAAGRVLWVGTDLSQWDGEATTSTVYGDTWEDAKRRAKDAVARIRTEIVAETVAPTPQDDAESAASTGHPTVAPTGRNTGVSVASAGRKGPDSDSRTSHYADIEPERSPRVAPAQERATGATVTPRRAPYISNNTAKRGGRPVKTTKLQMSPLLIDYYRNRDGFQQDIELILAKTGIGPAALARVLGVSRGRIHAWRSQGLPDRMDPLAFLQVALWVAILRGNKWPWQR